MEEFDTGTSTQQIVRFGREASHRQEDEVAREEPLQIRLRGGGEERAVAVTMRTPGRDEDLALGLLFNEGVLGLGGDAGTVATASNQILVFLSGSGRVDWGKLARQGFVSSSCGVCGKASLEQVEDSVPHAGLPGRWVVSAALIREMPARMRPHQQLFARTGGIHAAGLFTFSGELVDVAEDIGRHNAVDKVTGAAFRRGALPLDGHGLVLSGRAGFELIQKAAMAGVGLVVSVGAPSSLAVELAREQGITLCGFVRESGFNCYSFPERILNQ